MGPGKGKNKEFRDPVHGYISVPADWCSAFIDTAIFQRLRHIEQTSMCPLYPSARHDRFAHSLGVYHLAKMAFQSLRNNTDETILDGVSLDDYRDCFLVAALMHDCAHACFSHTFEYLYGKKGNARSDNTKAEEFLFSVINDDESFIRDFKSGSPPADHEIFSAAVFLAHYKKAFENLELKGDPLLVARMITGCFHRECKTTQKQVENSLIALINGATIDVDKLDYILRDTWASGVDNVSIDVQRLLSALEIVVAPVGWLDVAFRKSALSVLQNVIDGRNYLFRWIYSHHTVCYYNILLRRAVELLDQVLSPPGTEAFLDAISSRDAFQTPIAVGSFSVFLPCDDDIYCLLKSHKEERSELKELVDELLSRKPTRVPLWKTQAEFEILFHTRTLKDRSAIYRTAIQLLRPILGEDLLSKVLVENAKPKVVDLLNFDENRLWVKFKMFGEDEIKSYQEIAETWQEAKTEKTKTAPFYVYIPREAADKASECIKALTTAKIRVS